MSINCLGMRGENLGRFSASSLAPPQRSHELFKHEKKILHLPLHKLFSHLHSYDHCVSCRLWGWIFISLKNSGLHPSWVICACEVTQRVQSLNGFLYEGVIIKRWEPMFSLVDLWWKLLITRLEDLARASEVPMLWITNACWKNLLVDAETPQEDTLA